MPITLGCPSCGKRFRARDESAGKRVKCPFCQAAVPVPTAEESAAAGAPTESLSASAPPPPARKPAPSSPEFSLPPVDPPTPPPVPKPKPVPVAPAQAADWGADRTASQPLLLEVESSPPAQDRERPWPHRPAVTDEPTYTPPDRTEKKGGKKPRPADAESVPGWRAAYRGLRWVTVGLFFLALIGMVPFGKLVYERAVGELPNGPGWLKIDGYLNTEGVDVIHTTQREDIDVLAYGLPVLLGGFLMVFGRVIAGSAPGGSGAKGLFFFSGLFTLAALVGALSIPVCEKVHFYDAGRYAQTAFVVGGALAEFWFLMALGNAAGAVRKPAAARAVGRFALLIGLAYLVATVGWEQYVKHGSDVGRPKPLDADWKFMEEAAKMLGWLLVFGCYARAVGAVRGGIRTYIEDVQDGRPAR
ncbi:MAG: hypothetical protein U0804_00325 [Gemmataceae bacterium]